MRPIPTRLNQAHRFWFFLVLELLMVTLTISRFLPRSIPASLLRTISGKEALGQLQELGPWTAIGLPIVVLLLAWQIISVIRAWLHIIRCDLADQKWAQRVRRAKDEWERLEQKG